MKAMTRSHAKGIKTLKALGIKTTDDLDALRWKNKTATCVPSRYTVLVDLVGDDAAGFILNDLAITQCNHVPR